MFSANLYRLVIAVLTSTTFSAIAQIGSAVLTIRYLGAELYGAYAYFAALAATPAILYTVFPKALPRFVPVLNEGEGHRLLIAVFFWQIAALSLFTIVALAIFLPWTAARFWTPHLVVGEQSLQLSFFLLLAAIPIALLNQLLTQYAAAIQRIKTAHWVRTAADFLRFLVVVAVTFTCPEKITGLEIILFAMILTDTGRFTVLCYLHQRWSRVFTSLSAIPVADWKEIAVEQYRNYLRSYIGPLQLQAIFAFVRNHLAAFLLGQQYYYTAVTNYEIMRKVYDFANKWFPALFGALLPRSVKSVEQDLKLYQKKFFRLTWLVLFIYLGMAGVLNFTAEFWLAIFGLEANEKLGIMSVIFSIHLVMAGLAHPCSWAIQLSKSTLPLFTNSMLRAAIFVIFLTILSPTQRELGAAWALMLSTISVVLFLSYSAAKTEFFSFRLKIKQLALTTFLILVFLFLRDN